MSGLRAVAPRALTEQHLAADAHGRQPSAKRIAESLAILRIALPLVALEACRCLRLLLDQASRVDYRWDQSPPRKLERHIADTRSSAYAKGSAARCRVIGQALRQPEQIARRPQVNLAACMAAGIPQRHSEAPDVPSIG